MRISRRGFAAGAVAAAGMLGGRSGASAATYTFKMGHDVPIDHPLHVWLKQMWAAVAKESGGRIDVTIFPNSQLGGDSAMLGQLRAGALQFMALDGKQFDSVVPACGILGVGWAFHDAPQAWSVLHGELGTYLRGEIATKGILCLPPVWDLGMKQITTATKPIRTAVDMEGLRIRTPASKAEVDLFRTLGASPTPIQASELYVSLQTHLVDAVEIPFSVIESFRVYEVQKYLSVSNHLWAGYWMLVNPEVWNGLPQDLRDIVLRNEVKYSAYQRRDNSLLNLSLSEKLVRQGLIRNVAEPATFQAKLGPYYVRSKGEYGAKAWDLLEKAVGKLA